MQVLAPQAERLPIRIPVAPSRRSGTGRGHSSPTGSSARSGGVKHSTPGSSLLNLRVLASTMRNLPSSPPRTPAADGSGTSFVTASPRPVWSPSRGRPVAQELGHRAQHGVRAALATESRDCRCLSSAWRKRSTDEPVAEPKKFSNPDPPSSTRAHRTNQIESQAAGVIALGVPRAVTAPEAVQVRTRLDVQSERLVDTTQESRPPLREPMPSRYELHIDLTFQTHQ